ncbi:MAG: DUF899 family protein [Hyphomonadaceae bacterium]|nr:DUF899 family protein [Hyphomonadaceae bacterium]
MTLRNTPHILELSTRLQAVRKELRQALAETVRADVGEYVFRTLGGAVTLKSLFGGKRDLFVVHNMGAGCNSCSMWADGLNGFYPHIADRAVLVVASPDPPAVQAEFAASRGWRFPMVSTMGTSFSADMGFATASGGPMPGVSAFQMTGEQVARVSASPFDDFDEFCLAWRLFDLLPEGADGWRPKRTYG